MQTCENPSEEGCRRLKGVSVQRADDPHLQSSMYITQRPAQKQTKTLNRDERNLSHVAYV